ncbi:MAG: lipoyl(octanoyl) transferase LipB, partial [Bdellovibrionota bacterium]
DLSEPKSLERVSVQDWGLIDYESALQRQFDLVDLVSRELARDTLVVCSHPPVVTLGRATKPGDVFGWSGSVIEVNRGGRATYHGPSQIVVYPILDLNQRGRDLHKYMRILETAMIETLKEFGIEATGRSVQTMVGDDVPVEATGVWVGSRKIASIGLGVRNWVSFHGLAMNIDFDPKAFQGMNPCGFKSETMISMEEALDTRPNRQAVQDSLINKLKHLL